MHPDQGVFLLQSVFLPSLHNEHGITAKVIAAIPTDKGDYRPDPCAKSAMELAWHLASAELWFLDSVAAGEFDPSSRTAADNAKTSADVARWYGEEFGRRVEKLNKLSGEQLVKIMDFRGFIQLPAVMYLGFSLHHSVHHRGQLSTYLRPMGGKVPAIYGESYDSAEARKASQSAR